MKFVSYSLDSGEEPRFGYLEKGYVVDVLRAAIWSKEVQNNDEFLSIPTTLRTALAQWSLHYPRLKELAGSIPQGSIPSLSAGGKKATYPENEVTYFPPVFDSPSFRDFYAFEKHVSTARNLRGLDVPDEWYKIPVFYFSNSGSLMGQNTKIPYPEGSRELDYELELGCYISEGGKNIERDTATNYIAGYTIINDWSARDFQRDEMVLNLGPAKGKDFATSVGPAMVTPDELQPFIKDGKLSLEMKAFVNGKQLSNGNSGDMYHSFATMIERASKNVTLNPGDLIGSGTVGSGCILELRPENTDGWLKPGDTISLSVEGLGTLENRII